MTDRLRFVLYVIRNWRRMWQFMRIGLRAMRHQYDRSNERAIAWIDAQLAQPTTPQDVDEWERYKHASGQH